MPVSKSAITNPAFTLGLATVMFKLKVSFTSLIVSLAKQTSALKIGNSVVEPFHTALLRLIALPSPLIIFFALLVCPSMLICQFTTLLNAAEKTTVCPASKSTVALSALNSWRNLKVL